MKQDIQAVCVGVMVGLVITILIMLAEHIK